MCGALVAGEKPGFRRRGYLGWITDLDSRPDTNAAWPSMRLDAPLLSDYRATFRLMRRLGFNEATMWGLYVSRAWPVDLASCITPQRGALVRQLIDAAHQQGIRIYAGLGVCSWGFDQIIRAFPRLSRGNPNAMCGSEPESWIWMQAVIDFVFARFPLDGVSLQSADQGRCRCDQCRAYSDTEYHARLNVKTSEYIRSRWRGKTVAVNGWGMNFQDPQSLPPLASMSRSVDYLIDVHDTTRNRDPAHRRKVVESLQCAFGTLGGPQVEPPQHWERDRWFLPTVKRQSEHLVELYAEGGRACEYFFHVLKNPGDEVSFHLAGKVLSGPLTPWQTYLRETIQELYKTKQSATGALAEVFIRAEDAYFQHLPGFRSGTISLEPLVSDRPGQPVYLTRRLKPEQRAQYRRDLIAIAGTVHKLAPEVPEKVRLRRVLRGLDNVLKDLGA